MCRKTRCGTPAVHLRRLAWRYGSLTQCPAPAALGGTLTAPGADFALISTSAAAADPYLVDGSGVETRYLVSVDDGLRTALCQGFSPASATATASTGLGLLSRALRHNRHKFLLDMYAKAIHRDECSTTLPTR